MSSTAKTWLKYFFIMCGWFLLYLAGTELFMRVFVVSTFPYEILKNGHIFEVWGIEGYGITRYLPYAEVETPYDSGTVQVAVLGNSYTMSKQVMDWQNYVSVAETKLHKDGYQVDLHNLGINGLTLPSYIARSSFVLEQYKPDIVVIQASPAEFFSDGFQSAMRGGHFEYNSSDVLEVVPPKSPDLLLPEQIGANSPSVDIKNYSSIFVYLSYIGRQVAEGGRPTIDRKGHPQSEIATTELQLLAKAYGDVPIVFILIPHDISAKKRTVLYEDGPRYKLIMDIIAREHPNWKVVYPLIEFNQLLRKGYSPMGFDNTKPFLGHMNVSGHQVVGDLLAQMLESMLK